MSDQTWKETSNFKFGDHVELMVYHRMRTPYGGWSNRYLAPGLRGKVIDTEPNPERGQLLRVRYEHGPPAVLYADEVRKISYEEAFRGTSDLPTLDQQISFIRSLLEEKGLSESEAAALVGVSELAKLTEGPEGTAQQLIDCLLS